jgi:hypothetical protein
VPKKDNPQKVGDFRLISLLNNSMKVLAKLLANHLQSSMAKLVIKISMDSSKEEQFKAV